MLGLHYCVSELFIAPSITMLQNTTSVKNQGFAVSVYTVAATLGGLLGTTALGYLQKSLGAVEDVSLYGTTLAGFVFVAYLMSIPLYY
jgi:hypothetical protein